jgi:hypothetical protein
MFMPFMSPFGGFQVAQGPVHSVGVTPPRMAAMAYTTPPPRAPAPLTTDFGQLQGTSWLVKSGELSRAKAQAQLASPTPSPSSSEEQAPPGTDQRRPQGAVIGKRKRQVIALPYLSHIILVNVQLLRQQG